MLRNYFKTAIRSLIKNWSYSMTNILGLAIGMAAVLAIAQYVSYEYSFDGFHDKQDRIYRLNLGRLDAGVASSATSAGVMGPVLKDNYPGIKAFVRLRKFPSLVIKEEKRFHEDAFYFTDSSFFEIFSYELIEGNKHQVLREPNTIVLTESSALRLFNRSSGLVGETLKVDNIMSYKIDGIVKDTPQNAHFNFEYLASIASIPNHYNVPLRTYQFNEWYAHYLFTYFVLEDNVDAKAFETLIRNASKTHSNPESYELYGTNMGLYLQNISEIHLDPMYGEIGAPGNKDSLYILASAGVIILLLAIVNYTNLSTAQSMKRVKEIALRKTLGAGRNQLIAHFLSHSILISFLAFILAISLIQILQSPLMGIMGIPQSAFFEFYGNNLLTIVIAAFTVGGLAGVYPALLLTSYDPNQLFRQQGTGKQRFLFRKIVIFLQFSISIFLISSTVIVFSQVQFMQEQELGINTEQILLLPTYGNEEIHDAYDEFRQNISGITEVQSSTLSELSPGETAFGIVSRFEGMDANRSFTTIAIDYDYVNTYDLKLIAGRDFSREISTDNQERVIINRKLSEQLGWSPNEAIGKTYDFGGDGNTPGFVIGVVEDFHFNSLKESIFPVSLVIEPNFYQKIAVKLNTTNLRETVAKIDKAWGQVYPQWPFDYSLADVAFDLQYAADKRFGSLFLIFTVLGLFIGALGIYGLIQLMTEYKRKELSIRKVLGAQLWRLVHLLSREYAEIMLLAFIVCAPLVYYFMNQWLADFAYNIQIQWWMIALSLITIVAMCMITIGTKVYKAARSNPVDSLRYD